MIVVGILAPSPAATAGAGNRPTADPVVEIARRSAAAGARTEIAGVAPSGAAGDRQLAQLAKAGVGHATMTRSAASGIDAADLDLALRYLPDVRAIVLVQPAPNLLATAVAASGWSGATLVLVGPLDRAAIDVAGSGPQPAIVLDPPARDPDGAFAGVVAALAVRLDAGEDPASAWKATMAALALDPA